MTFVSSACEFARGSRGLAPSVRDEWRVRWLPSLALLTVSVTLVGCQAPTPPDPIEARVLAADPSARPRTVEQAIEQLEYLLPEEVQTQLQGASDDDLFLVNTTLGREIRNRWILPEGSPLTEKLRRQGVLRPESMSLVVLRVLRGKLREGRLDVVTAIRQTRDEERNDE